MARAFVDDRWLKNDEDGNPPSRAAKQSLANAKDPMKANVPGKWRSALYGQGSRWRCRWYTLRDGKRVQKSRNFAKLRDAEEYAAAIEDDIRRGKYRDPQQELRIFRDVASEWTDGKMDIKQGTLGRYRRELRVYINPKWGDRTLRDTRLRRTATVGHAAHRRRVSRRTAGRSRIEAIESTQHPQHRQGRHGRCHGIRFGARLDRREPH